MTKVWTRLLRAVPLCTITAIFPAAYVPLKEIPDKTEVRQGFEHTIHYADGAKFLVQYALPWSLWATRVSHIEQPAAASAKNVVLWRVRHGQGIERHRNVCCRYTEENLSVQLPPNYGTIQFNHSGDYKRLDETGQKVAYIKTEKKDMPVIIHSTRVEARPTGICDLLCMCIVECMGGPREYDIIKKGTLIDIAAISSPPQI